MVAINTLSNQYKELFAESGPLADLGAPSKNNFFFPGDLGNLDHWVAFTIVRHSRKRRQSKELRSPLKTIFLPIPSNLGTTYAAGYDSEALGPLGAIAAENINLRGADASSVGKRVADGLSKVTADDLKGAAMNLGLKGVENNIGAIVAGVMGDKLSGLAGATTAGLGTLALEQGLKGALFGSGIARNPHMAVLFSGVDFRVHNFQYKLIAKTPEESEMIKDIIYTFKYHMAPSYKARDHFFDYPEQFDIDFHHARKLFNISSSVLKSFEVNYHGEGVPAYHKIDSTFGVDDDVNLEIGEDLAPVSVTINMSFQETTIATKEEIKNENR